MGRPLRKKFRFLPDERGVAAIEFALVAPMFIAIVIAILESSIQQIYVSYLDNAVQAFATDMRSGYVVLRDVNSRQAVEQLLSNKLCPQLAVLPGLDCSKLQAQLFLGVSCKTIAVMSCWDAQYSNFTNAVRKPPTFVTSAPTFVVGGAGDSQYLTVYYPFPKMSAIWDRSPTATVNGEQVHGLLSTAIWINDPSVGYF